MLLSTGRRVLAAHLLGMVERSDQPNVVERQQHQRNEDRHDEIYPDVGGVERRTVEIQRKHRRLDPGVRPQPAVVRFDVGVLGYMATSGAKPDVRFLFGDPDFL